MRQYSPERPSFSREAVYAAWADAHSKQWRLDENELVSARKLLNRASKGETVPYKVEMIPIQSPDGYESFGFSLKNIAEQWGARIREIAIDSTCTSHVQTGQ